MGEYFSAVKKNAQTETFRFHSMALAENVFTQEIVQSIERH